MDILAQHQQLSLHQLSPQLQSLQPQSQSQIQLPHQIQHSQPTPVLPLPQPELSQQLAQDLQPSQDQPPPPPRRAASTPKVHAAHPGCPDNLGCLADSDTKPRDTFATIIRCAILGTAAKRMTLNCIYNAIEDKYPYYRDAGPGWKNTVRHVLSTSQQFEKSRRPITEPGKGGYWSVSKTLPKSDNHRARRVNRVVSRKERDPAASEPSPQIQTHQSPPSQHSTQPSQATSQAWAPQQISVPWLQYQDFSYMRSIPQPPPGSDQSSEVDSRYSPHLQPSSIVAAIPQYSDHHSYQVVAPISPMPQLPQYTHSNHLIYSYEKTPERPGWLTEVSWNNAPLGAVPAHGRQ